MQRPGHLDHVDLQHLNTLTGRYTSFKRPGDSMYWLLDNNAERSLTDALDTT